MPKRLADLRVADEPFLYSTVVVGLILATILKRRSQKRLTRIASDLGTFYGERFKEQDARDNRLVELTNRLFWLTIAVCAATIAGVGVAAFALNG